MLAQASLQPRPALLLATVYGGFHSLRVAQRQLLETLLLHLRPHRVPHIHHYRQREQKRRLSIDATECL
jgi:NAD(P)H-dependent FMN reductase